MSPLLRSVPANSVPHATCLRQGGPLARLPMELVPPIPVLIVIRTSLHGREAVRRTRRRNLHTVKVRDAT